MEGFWKGRWEVVVEDEGDKGLWWFVWDKGSVINEREFHFGGEDGDCVQRQWDCLRWEKSSLVDFWW